MGLGLNFRRMINEAVNKIAALQSNCKSRLLEKSDVSKKANKRMVKPADMIKPTEEAFRLFRAAAT